MKIRALAIITALALPTFALADESAPPPPDKPADKPMDRPADKPTNKAAKLGVGDVKIIAHLHHVNQMEIDLGKLAQKSGTAVVKSYGETLEKDHQSADKDLTAFAKQHKLAAIPADKPASDADRQEHKDMMQQMARLKMLKGAEFDRELLNMMVSGHDKELARIDVSISSASDTDLQNMLEAVKPVLQRHADQARDLQKGPQASADRPGSDRPGSDRPATDRPIDKLPSQR